jgi:hypothetical protein
VEEEKGLHDRVLGCMIPSCEGICKLFTHVHGEQLQVIMKFPIMVK